MDLLRELIQDNLVCEKKQRPLILCWLISGSVPDFAPYQALLKFIHKDILPSLEQRKEFVTILNKQFRGHAKDRTNAYLALLMLILERMLKYIPFYGENDLLYGLESGDKEICTAWIEEQNQAAKETERGSNTILQLLDGLVREYVKLLKDKNVALRPEPGYDDEVFVLEHPEYGLKPVKTRPETVCECGEKPEVRQGGGEKYIRSVIEFVAASGEIVDAFDRYCKATGKRNPYDSASVFTARLRNDRNLLAKSGWELVITEGKEPYFRIIRGNRFRKFRHVMVR